MSIAIRRNVRRAGAALMAAVVAAALCLNAAMPAHADDKQKELENKKNELQSELDQIRQQLKDVASDKAEAEQQKQLLVQEREKVGQKLSLLHTKASLIDGQAERQNRLISALVQCADGGKLDACLVESLIEQIFIYQGKRAVIVWRWRDTAQKTREGMHGRGSCDEALWNGGAG